MGYTFTAGCKDAAIDAVLVRKLTEVLSSEEADHTERLRQKAWWALHYGRRGGPAVLALSAFDMALWDLKANRAGVPLWNLLGGFASRAPAYAGGVNLGEHADRWGLVPACAGFGLTEKRVS